MCSSCIENDSHGLHDSPCLAISKVVVRDMSRRDYLEGTCSQFLSSLTYHISLHIPKGIIVTDCFGFLNAVDNGFVKALTHKSFLARLWRTVVSELDGQHELDNLYFNFFWMSSHTSLHDLAAFKLKHIEGQSVPATVLHWGANRLVDAVAKAAGAPFKLLDHSVEWLALHRGLLKNALTLIGQVTWAVNNHVMEVSVNGKTVKKTCRHSTGMISRKHNVRKKRKRVRESLLIGLLSSLRFSGCLNTCSTRPPSVLPGEDFVILKKKT